MEFVFDNYFVVIVIIIRSKYYKKLVFVDMEEYLLDLILLNF